MEAAFINEDFLLSNETAKILYYQYAKDLPIIDYHNHLPPDEIAGNKKFKNLTEIWLKGDHYKWRAMRAHGINEKYITGDASDEEKFLQWAKVVPYTIRNPLFHWTHLELQNPFGILEYLNESTASSIYNHCNALLEKDNFSTRSLLQHFKVEMVGTTDDPCDDLAAHRQLAVEGFATKVLPSFRPDKACVIQHRPVFIEYIRRLEKSSGVRITDIPSFLTALQKRVDYFHENGCRVSDHGFQQLPSSFVLSTAAEKEFADFISSENAKPFSEPEAFFGFILIQLCRMYHAKGWVQQFHLGALRNNNSRMLRVLGPDTGFDSIADISQAASMSRFFDELDNTSQLTKTILYNLNPADNELFATMTGNFNDGTIKGKIQFGSGWWFLDQKDGMEKQLNALSNMGLVSSFIGMITDSRSFLSYSRHEYFRRVLCNLFGAEMERGELPNDEKWIGEIVQNICYYNAKDYFNV
ncbi:MAG: glucuronate isomerase [Chitinophagaceae bacterium]|nr:glucuronate isomerase [Chitinophagaceae bacterium]